MLVAQGSLMRSHVSVSVTNKPECLKVSAHYMMLIHTESNVRGRNSQAKKKNKKMFDLLWCVFFFLKYNSIFHFTLASTTGGKDLGLVVGIYITRRPKMSFFSFISRWFGLLSFSFFFLLHMVWHTRFHLQSAMEAEGLAVLLKTKWT